MHRPEAVVDDVDSADAFKSDIKLSIIRVLGMMYLTTLSNDIGHRRRIQGEQQRLVDQFATELDKGNITRGVFIDQSKAFDTSDHNILLDKLYMYGVRGNCLDWIRSYLTHRKQYVYLIDAKSDMLYVNCGVPQGSILGPLVQKV